MTGITHDSRFSQAVNATVNGNAQPLAVILRNNALPLVDGNCETLVLGPGERELLATLAERCAELARGETREKTGRPKGSGGIAEANKRNAVIEYLRRHRRDGEKSEAVISDILLRYEINRSTFFKKLSEIKEIEEIAKERGNPFWNAENW